MFTILSRTRAALTALLLLALTQLAGTAATAETLLTIANADNTEIKLDRKALEGMRRVSFTTETIWTTGPMTFEGVPLKALLDAAGIKAGIIRAVALNDYIVDIPVNTLENDLPIVADLIDGKPFSRRNNGPLWIVYPYSKDMRFRSEETYGRSVWQLVALRVN